MSDSIEECSCRTCPHCGEVAVHPFSGDCMECGMNEDEEVAE